jgi:ribonuclease HI
METLSSLDSPLFINSYLNTIPVSSDLIRFTLVFNWAVWHTAHELSSGSIHPDNAPKRIASKTLSSYTQSVKDAATQKKAKKIKFEAFRDTLSKTATCVYTDGSAIGNPGPCGAGAIIIRPGEEPIRLFCPLLEGTNNVGEAWAIGMALSFLKENSRVGEQIHLFTDSRITLGQLESGWRFKTNKCALHSLQALRKEFPDLSLYKVPAHVGVVENEEADTLANEGSSQSPPPSAPDLFHYILRPNQT